jgi:nitroreductase
MDFQALVKNRWSVRKFKTDALPDEVMAQILEAGRVAPTACNFQPQRVFVIRSAEAMEKVKKCTRCHFNAPVVLLVCCDHDTSWKRKYDGADSGVVDASIVTTHMMLAAEELGVGSCWVMHFNPAVLRSELALPENLEPVALLPMGYPAEDAEPIAMHFQRKPLDELVKVL